MPLYAVFGLMTLLVLLMFNLNSQGKAQGAEEMCEKLLMADNAPTVWLINNGCR